MNCDSPRISVIIAVKNASGSLERCLRSIKLQSYGSIEIVVVDGMSTDDTVAVARRYTSKVIQTPCNRTQARNIGLHASGGRFVMIIDSDMELTQEVARECVVAAESGFNAVTIPEVARGTSFLSNALAFDRNLIAAELALDDVPRFYARELLVRAGGWNENITHWGEDRDLFGRLAPGTRAFRIRAPVIHHESVPSLAWIWRKYREQSRSFKDYLRSHPGELNPIGNPEWVKPYFTRQGLHRILGSPCLFVGAIALKVVKNTSLWLPT